MYEQLPKQLRDYPYLGLWKYEKKDGRRTKVPKTVSGYNANSKNLKQFCGFDEVADTLFSVILLRSLRHSRTKRTLLRAS